MPILDDRVSEYLASIRPPRDAVLSDMERQASDEGIPIVHWETGRFLAILVRELGTKARVLEVGTAIGYSTLQMAQALGKRGEIVTIERDPARVGQAVEYLQRAGVGERVRVAEGDALGVIGSLRGEFDLLFLDATKGEYADYLRLAEPLLSKRATLVVDNVLMSGSVALPDDAEVPDSYGSWWTVEQRQAIRTLSRDLIESDHWLAEVLPIGDGVLLAARV